MPLERLTFCRGELSKKHPVILETLCQGLVNCLRYRLADLVSTNMLADRVGQPFLLTLTALAKGSLWYDCDMDRLQFIKRGHKEVIEESMKGKYLFGSKDSWRVMVSTFLRQFSDNYPSSVSVLTAVLQKFKTRQDLEET